MTVLELQYWRQLSIPILLGIPEVSRAEDRTGKLLKDGIYRVVRHPRYLSAGIGVVGNALFINNGRRRSWTVSFLPDLSPRP